MLKKMRERKGLLQKEVAERLGVPASALCKWEKGIRMVPSRYLKRLASILECSVDELLSEGGCGDV